jgi:phosphohistidine phosphatase SixA
MEGFKVGESTSQRKIVFLAIRHCESAKAEEPGHIGNLRRKLTQKGEDDALKLARYLALCDILKDWQFRLISSPAIRCIRTTIEIAYVTKSFNFQVLQCLGETSGENDELNGLMDEVIQAESTTILISHNSTISAMHKRLNISPNLGDTMLPGEIIIFYQDQNGVYSSESLYAPN